MTARPLIFGEVLFDCFPDNREILGGAPFNVAWNLQAFGMNPYFVSRIGDDRHGHRIRTKMKAWAMETVGLQVDPASPTGMVRIELNKGEPQFAILPDQAYDNISPSPIPDVQSVSFLYHGSLALRNENNRTTLAGLKDEHNCPVFLDVNLRKPWWSKEMILPLIEDATWLKLNEHELDSLFPDKGDLERRIRSVLVQCSLEALFLTRGDKGAIAATNEERIFSVRPSRNIAIVDTVGAGDAFSSVLLLGLMHKWSLSTTLDRAQDFASAIVGLRGATSLDKEFYQTFKNNWTL